MRTAHMLRGAATAAAIAMLGACGGSDPVVRDETCPAGQVGTPPNCAPPAVSITAAASGNLEIHPSLDNRFGFALVAPIRITETGGGTADWNFARVAIFLSGAEIERYELGSNDIRASGYGRIAARSNEVYSVVYRQNSDRFDRIDITLGFADLKDARQFTVAVPFVFDDVVVSLTPLFAPPGGMVRFEGR
jgi:hypothetical protein